MRSTCCFFLFLALLIGCQKGVVEQQEMHQDLSATIEDRTKEDAIEFLKSSVANALPLRVGMSQEEALNIIKIANDDVRRENGTPYHFSVREVFVRDKPSKLVAFCVGNEVPDVWLTATSNGSRVTDIECYFGNAEIRFPEPFIPRQ